jgi:hypothetical protein
MGVSKSGDIRDNAPSKTFPHLNNVNFVDFTSNLCGKCHNAMWVTPEGMECLQNTREICTTGAGAGDWVEEQAFRHLCADISDRHQSLIRTHAGREAGIQTMNLSHGAVCNPALVVLMHEQGEIIRDRELKQLQRDERFLPVTSS